MSSRLRSMMRAGRSSIGGAAAALTLLLSLLAVSTPVRAQSAAMAVCEQSFAAWALLRDGRLRRLASTAASAGSAWCSPAQADIAELKTRLFALDQVCAGVAADEKSRVVALMTQNLQMLKRVTLCAGAVQAAAPPLDAWQTGISPAPEGAKAISAPPIPSDAAISGSPPNVARVVPRVDPPAAAVKPAAKVAAPAARNEAPGVPQKIAAAPPPASKPPPATLPEATASVDPRPAPPKNPARLRVAGTPLPAANADLSAGPGANEEEECLAVRRTSSETFMIDNSRCQQQRVLAAIELQPAGAPVRCFTKSITDQLAITGGTAPQINFQCISGTAGCTVESMRSMFPECAAD